MKSIMVAITLFPAFALSTSPAAAQVAVDPKIFKPLPDPGAKVMLDPDTYFIYGFTSAPKLGTAIMRVEIFRRDGQRDTTFTVKADLDMPSMRGAHATGQKPFVLSAKGQYLRPAPLVMPGEWEFRFTFEKGGKPVFRGAYLFKL